MSAPTDDEKPRSKLQEMCIRGAKFREDYDFEMFGEEVTAVLAPLPDQKFLPIAAFLKDHLGMDEDEAVEAIEDAKAEAEEAGEDTIDISKMDTEFVVTVQQAAIQGLKGSRDEDGDVIDHTEDEAREMVEMMVGGFSVEIGGKVLELSGDVRDATKFRGSRGSL
jgi:hypothetical protein